jgi:hypothetical protein
MRLFSALLLVLSVRGRLIDLNSETLVHDVYECVNRSLHFRVDKSDCYVATWLLEVVQLGW